MDMRARESADAAAGGRARRIPRWLGTLLRLRPYEVELLRARPPAMPLAWLLLCAALFALGGAALVARPAWNRQQELESRRTALATALAGAEARGSSAPGAGRPAGSASHAANAAERDEAAALLAELRRPWHELFDQLEAAAAADGASVHVVQLGVDARFATIQLVAEGRDLGKLMKFAQRLDAGGPVRGMTMTHHEWRDALGAHVVSATMQGELPAPAGVSP
jgi:hypothetical protein